MSLRPTVIGPVPAPTAQVAHAAFPRGNVYLTLREKLGTVFRDEDFADLYPDPGRPGLSPWRLALVTVLQFRENLSDHQAAEAVRARIDWKYLLGLELTDPGFDYSVLSEFRARLSQQQASERMLEKLLAQCQAPGLLRAGGRQRTDATHVLAAVRILNRLELVAETCAWLSMLSRPWHRSGSSVVSRRVGPSGMGGALNTAAARAVSVNGRGRDR